MGRCMALINREAEMEKDYQEVFSPLFYGNREKKGNLWLDRSFGDAGKSNHKVTRRKRCGIFLAKKMWKFFVYFFTSYFFVVVVYREGGL